MKFTKQFEEILLRDIKNNASVMLLGEVGIGKSSFVEHFAQTKLDSQCFTLACNQLAEKADLTGQRLVPVGQDEFKTVFYPHFTIMDAILYARENPTKTPILFLDEINRTTSDTTSALLSLITQRRIGSIDLPKNIIIMAAGNDKGNIVVLDEASLTRFTIYSVEPDVDTFLSINKNINPYIEQVLRADPSLLFAKKVHDINENAESDWDDMAMMGADEMYQLTTPRTLKALSDMLNDMSDSEIKTLFANDELTEIIEAKVGHTAFTIRLLEKIASTVGSLNYASGIQKPSCYNKIEAITDTDDLANFLETLPNKDVSESLIYALYDAKDNAQIVKQASLVIDDNKEPIDTNSLITIVQGIHSHTFNDENLEVFMSMNTGLVNDIKRMTQTIGTI